MYDVVIYYVLKIFEQYISHFLQFLMPKIRYVDGDNITLLYTNKSHVFLNIQSLIGDKLLSRRKHLRCIFYNLIES